VIPPEFDYVKVSSVDDATSALAGGGEEAKVLAGGQSLIPLLRLRLAYPSMLVDVSGVAEMKGVRDDGDAIVIGAMTTHSDVLADGLIAQHAPLIARATETVADRQVRHRGTFGGALAHADPAGDLPAVALALDAVRHLGVADIQMPLTPERVWRAIHQGGSGGERATAGTNAYGGASTETTAGVSTDESSLGGDR